MPLTLAFVFTAWCIRGWLTLIDFVQRQSEWRAISFPWAVVDLGHRRLTDRLLGRGAADSPHGSTSAPHDLRCPADRAGRVRQALSVRSAELDRVCVGSSNPAAARAADREGTRKTCSVLVCRHRDARGMAYSGGVYARDAITYMACGRARVVPVPACFSGCPSFDAACFHVGWMVDRRVSVPGHTRYASCPHSWCSPSASRQSISPCHGFRAWVPKTSSWRAR